MPEAVLIFRKYPNRRIYDNALSRYTTLMELRSHIEKGVKVIVVDHRSQQDITREVLFDVLKSKEHIKPTLEVEKLHSMIRYGDAT